MKAAVFHSPKKITADTVPDPTIQDAEDIILKVTSTAICGSDLHIYNGFLPQTRPITMGHEFMGIVEEVGKGVTKLKRGDRVVVPFPIACGQCWFCNHLEPGHCENSNPEKYGPEGAMLDEKGAALFGYTDLYGGYDGGQAELVRVPYANFGPRKISDALTDEQVLFLTDIFPTGYSAIEKAQLQGGETVAVFGCGPVGLMTIKAAFLKGAKRVIALDFLEYRTDMAKKCGADVIVIKNEKEAIEHVRFMTEGRGADLCVDAVGMEANYGLLEKLGNIFQGEMGTINALRMCGSAVRRGGKIAILGVYGMSYDNFPIGQIFDKGITIVGGQAPVHKYIDELIDHVESGRVKLDDIITHTIPLNDVAHGYEIFNKKEDNCVKVILKP